MADVIIVFKPLIMLTTNVLDLALKYKHSGISVEMNANFLLNINQTITTDKKQDGHMVLT